MTKQEMGQIHQIRQSIIIQSQKLIALRSRAECIKPKLDGMPRGYNRKDNMADIIDKIIKAENIISRQQRLLNRLILQAETQIRSISDKDVRRIFRLRYIGCLSWQEIADALGDGYTQNSVRKIIYRTQI